ncbi:MAG: hypothetical protein KC561_07590, partial [Myxococcales bacterium]|nr:hypothetical protein [Myxococcales bacterium]
MVSTLGVAHSQTGGTLTRSKRLALFVALATLTCLLPTVASAQQCTVTRDSTDWGGLDVFLLDNECWTGTHSNIGTLTVGSTFTLSVVPGAPLSISADTVRIDGHLSADRAGNPGGEGGSTNLTGLPANDNGSGRGG